MMQSGKKPKGFELNTSVLHTVTQNHTVNRRLISAGTSLSSSSPSKGGAASAIVNQDALSSQRLHQLSANYCVCVCEEETEKSDSQLLISAECKEAEWL